MPKKRHKGEKRTKIIDYAADENFDPKRTMVYIEHTEECPIYRIKANEFLIFLETNFPDRIFLLFRNKEGPRDGAFEISMSQTARTPITQIWSGIDKGPPRRDKFPNFDHLLPEITSLIKKMFVDPNAKANLGDSFDMLDLENDENEAGGEAEDTEAQPAPEQN